MVGHVNGNGYEGYNSSPSSPTKYTVNQAPISRNKKWVFSMLCIVLTAVLFILTLLVTNLLTYYLIPRTVQTNDYEKLGYIHKAYNDESGGVSVVYTESPPVVSTLIDLTNDQFEINLFTNSDEDLNLNTDDITTMPTETLQSNHIDYRLPMNIIPLHYRLRIIPFLDEQNLTTNGEVIIAMKCIVPTNTIVMNSKDIFVYDDEVTLRRNDTGRVLSIDSVELNSANEQLIIYLDNELEENQIYNIYIKYNGKIRNLSNGLYRSYFIDPNTKSKMWMVNTVFSPAYARYAYPSFDEPSFKARFSFSIGRSIDMMSLSNMNLSYSEPIHGMQGWIWDHYTLTPLMSTYLTAFLVAPNRMLMRNKAEKNTVPEISLWARPDDAYQTEIAINLTESILTFYEKYFDIKFPLNKIDIVGVPAHEYDAMENWGLIIFREGRLLVDQGNSASSQRTLALILAHEFAHQWFGNLVTPTWWDDLWLKEGFSTYFQYLAMAYIKPDWLLFETFTLNEMYSAFLEDSLITSPAVSRKVIKPNKELFDSITYHKGSAIIRMMTSFLDSAKLKMGIKKYLRKYSYANANQENLWTSLSEDGYLHDQNRTMQLKTVMDSWTLKPGYPVLDVIRDYKRNTAEITQERFLFNPKKTNNSELWWVPISYTTQIEKNFNNSMPKQWLAAERKTQISNLANNSWILLNIENTGFYRVNYDKDNWVMLIDDFKSLPAVTRAQLISDSLNLARGSRLSYDLALSMLNQLSSDIEYLPWLAATQSIHYLRNSLIKMPAYGDFREYIMVLIGAAYDSIIFNNDHKVPWKVSSVLIQQSHVENILHMSCLVGAEHCTLTAVDLFKMWIISPDEGNIIPEAIRSIVYCTAVREGGKAEWDFVYETFYKAALKGARFGSEQSRLIHALGCPSEQWLLTKALTLIQRPESGLTKEEGVALFDSVASNYLGHSIAFSYVQTQWKQLLEFYNTTTIIIDMVTAIVPYINTPHDVEQLKSLIDEIKNYTHQNSTMLDKAIEKVENNLIWMEKNYLIIENWLGMIMKDTVK